jgi:putative PIN family toxin of toxin-antitoxin system
LRLVLDTNTVLSGLIWHGPPGILIDAARDGRILLFSSVPLLAELQGVLERDKFAGVIAKRGVSVSDLLDGYVAMVEIVRPVRLGSTILRDPDDDVVLATALAASVDAIVSGDKDLTDFGRFRNIPIITAAHALSRLTR